MKNYSLIPKITLWILLAIGIVFSVMFYAFGESGSIEVAGEFLGIPRFTDTFLFWNYILVGIVLLVTICAVCVSFARKFKTDKKSAIKSLVVVLLFVVVAVVCWILGSPDEVPITGYEGTDNVGAMAQLTDAMMYMTYILFVGVIITICWGAIHTRRK